MTFKGTDISYEELTQWILQQFKDVEINEIRYFGSRSHLKESNPREDSDIDVYLLIEEYEDSEDDISPLFSRIFRKNGKAYIIEFHPYLDFHDGYVPTHLIGEAVSEI